MNLSGYFAAVLTKTSSDELKQLATLPKIFCHHITLAYNPNQEVAEKYQKMVGQKISLRVTGIRTSEKCQAALVEGIESENEHPHITMSVQNGVKPFYSNTLIKNKEGQLVNIGLNLEAEIVFNQH